MMTPEAVRAAAFAWRQIGISHNTILGWLAQMAEGGMCDANTVAMVTGELALDAMLNPRIYFDFPTDADETSGQYTAGEAW